MYRSEIVLSRAHRVCESQPVTGADSFGNCCLVSATGVCKSLRCSVVKAGPGEGVGWRGGG